MKEIITDFEKLSAWSSEVDPGKGGKNTQEIVTELKNVVDTTQLDESTPSCPVFFAII